MTAIAPLLATSFAIAGVAVAARTGGLPKPARPAKEEPYVQYQIVASDADAKPAVPDIEDRAEKSPESALMAESTILDDASTLEYEDEGALAVPTHTNTIQSAPQKKAFWASWFSLFQQPMKPTVQPPEENSGEGTLLDKLAADNPDLHEVVLERAAAMAHEGDRLDAAADIQLDSNGLIREPDQTPQPADTSHVLDAEEQQRTALVDAASASLELSKAEEKRREEERLLAEARAKAEANRWYVRLDPDLAADDVDGRIAITKDLVALRDVPWAQRLLVDALEQEPEARVRARIYGVLARIGGADYRRDLFEQAMNRGEEDRQAVIDAVASAAPPWAMDFLRAIV